MNDFPGTELVSAAPNGAMAGALVAREAQEVQAAVISAKRFPRDQKAAFERIIVACARPTLAESAMYAYPRGGETVTGPSIRLAEVLAQNWGNIQAGLRILSTDVHSSEVEAFCWDLETNFRNSLVFTVAHVRETRAGTKALTSERDIYELIANMGARRKRNCILAVIPGDMVETAIQECEKTLEGLGEKKEMVQAMVKAFQTDLGVTREDIERRCAKRIAALTSPEFVQLRKIFKSMKDGMSKAEQWFPPVLDPEKISKVQAEGANDKAPPAPAVAAAEKKAAIDEFEKMVRRVRDLGGDPEKIAGQKINAVLALTPADILAISDLLALWAPAPEKDGAK